MLRKFKSLPTEELVVTLQRHQRQFNEILFSDKLLFRHDTFEEYKMLRAEISVMQELLELRQFNAAHSAS